MPVDAAVYVRKSTDEQSVHSLEAQEKACREYCAKHDYRVRYVMRDVRSGRDIERPGFQWLIDHALARRISVIVVWHRDRFGRDAIDVGFVEKLMQKAGCHVESVTGGKPEDTPIGRFIKRTLDNAAELEADQIALRCALGRTEAIDRGEWPTRPPYGYRKDPQRRGYLIPDPHQSGLVQEAYRQYVAGRTIREVADRLGWNKDTLRHRLHDRAYVGVAMFGDRPIAVPAIVTPELWERVQARSRSNQQFPSAFKPAKHKPLAARYGPHLPPERASEEAA